MRHIRPRSAYDILALVSFFLVIGGGTALASYVVSSNSQVGPNTISGHKPPTGKHSNIITGSVNGLDLSANSVNSSKVTDASLTGSDLANGTVASSKLQLPKIDWSGADTDPVDNAPHHTAFTIDGVTIRTSCIPDSALDELLVFVSSSTSGTIRGNFTAGSDGSVNQVKIVDKSVSSTPVQFAAVENATLTGEFTYSDSNRVIAFALDGKAVAPTCDLHGTVVPAPN
jgi:hypothetical protein